MIRKHIWGAVQETFFLFFMGLVFSLVGYAIGVTNTLKKESLDSKVLAYDIDDGYYIDDEGSDMYSPTFYYTVDGIDYVCDTNFSSSTEVSGSHVYVYYDSKNPSDCSTDYHTDASSIGYIFLIVGVLLICKVIFKFIIAIKKGIKQNRIIKNGFMLKKVKFELQSTGNYIDEQEVFNPVIKMDINGLEYLFIGNQNVYESMPEEERYIDLVYDPENITDYIMDFNINGEKL